ncbi:MULTISPECIES: CoA-binding protein [Kocuria]|uniref:CoA-binding protein n=1 Tax=Kocuria gwangalliensis TaxID=501592 RepID=A0ABP8XG27_9MICC|nr:CoA-binding protein [Kocuria sp.]MDO5368422.1 CoA-binding protein [Kocuria sp.]
MSDRHVNDPDLIRELLTTPGRWAVVGLSSNRTRPAYAVSRRIREEFGQEIIPVNLAGESVHGETGYRSLKEIPGHVDVVDCFVNSRRVGDVVDQAIEIGAGAVWLQLGVSDQTAAARAKAAGVKVVMNTCPLIEAPRVL